MGNCETRPEFQAKISKAPERVGMEAEEAEKRIKLKGQTEQIMAQRLPAA
jgi:hypothetical protein